MQILSLFDGISCARVAAERMGIEVDKYYASEVDKFAMTIAKNRYPDTIHIGDVRYVENFMVGVVDLLIGGSPCQDLSIAKKNRKGLEGDRSGLFREYVRILKETKPRYFVLENVASMSKESKEIISNALGVQPIMINAALVSAQNRKRLFRTNIPGVIQPEDRGILLKDILEDEVSESYNVHSGNRRVERNTCSTDSKGICLNASNYKGALNDGMALVPTHIKQRARGYNPGGEFYEKVPTITTSFWEHNNHVVAAAVRGRPDGDKNTQKLELGGEKANSVTTVQKDSLVCRATVQKNAEEYKDKSPTITSAMGIGGSNVPLLMTGEKAKEYRGKYIDGEMRQHIHIRKITPIECERLQGLPDGYTEGVSNTQRYKCLGNAFNVDVVAHILSFIPR